MANASSKKQAAKKRGAPAKTKYFDGLSSSDFEEVDNCSDSDAQPQVVEHAPARVATGRACKQINYFLSKGEDKESESE